MLRLITMPISHYCEKARWALDRTGLAYREERHVQMVHWPYARRAGGGRTVPVLATPDAVYPESSDILHYADTHLAPGRQLYPAAYRTQVETLEAEFDEGFGVDTRMLYYHAMRSPGARAMLPYNNRGVAPWESALMWLMFPVARAFVLRHLDITDATIKRAIDRIRAHLDDVAQRLSDGRPYLMGDRFTAADLSFAALSAPLSLPPTYGVELPGPDEPLGYNLGHANQFRDHPAVEFALRVYENQRKLVRTDAVDKVVDRTTELGP